jgi:hypothetical protein
VNILNQPPDVSFVLQRNVLVTHLISKRINISPLLNVTNQVSQPYKTTGEIISLYILTFMRASR